MKKLWLGFKIRSLEVTIDGRDSIMHLVRDTITRINMEYAQTLARNELIRLKREYRK